MPPLTFQVLYCFFVIEHERRRILPCHVTRPPTSAWIVQQRREAFPEADPYWHMILDRDANCNAEVFEFLTALRLQPKRTSVQAPGQKGLAERWVGSIRREFLDQLIPRNERSLRRLRDYGN